MDGEWGCGAGYDPNLRRARNCSPSSQGPQHQEALRVAAEAEGSLSRAGAGGVG